MSAESFYNILGVEETASKDDIKKAYRALSMKHHPDKNPGNTECVSKFQKINEAYETLGDEQKRNEYDMVGKNPFANMSGHGVPMDDIFSAIFGGGFPGFPGGGFPGFPGGGGGFPGMPPGAKIHIFHGGHPMNFVQQQTLQKPPPIQNIVTINLEQVLTGATVPVDIERWIIEGGNKIFEKETVYVTIPKGADDNEMLLLTDKGNVLTDTNKGDIKIFIKIQNDTLFKRAGLDLILEKNISLKDALCGFSFEIKYINGKSYTLNNNSGNIIQQGYRKIIPKMGLSRDEHIGNLNVIFHVDFPEKLTEEQMVKLRETL